MIVVNKLDSLVLNACAGLDIRRVCLMTDYDIIHSRRSLSAGIIVVTPSEYNIVQSRLKFNLYALVRPLIVQVQFRTLIECDPICRQRRISKSCRSGGSCCQFNRSRNKCYAQEVIIAFAVSSPVVVYGIGASLIEVEQFGSIYHSLRVYGIGMAYTSVVGDIERVRATDVIPVAVNSISAHPGVLTSAVDETPSLVGLEIISERQRLRSRGCLERDVQNLAVFFAACTTHEEQIFSERIKTVESDFVERRIAGEVRIGSYEINRSILYEAVLPSSAFHCVPSE